MNDVESQRDAILSYLADLGVMVRLERLGGSGGGMCVVGTSRTHFVDLDADVATQVDRAAASLASLPGVDDIYLIPAIRERVVRAQTQERL